MYIDCDTHYFPVTFLEEVSAKYLSATWKEGTVKMVKEMEGVSESDKEKILGGNAMRLFGMEPI
jgi:hypothetical protein